MGILLARGPEGKSPPKSFAAKPPYLSANAWADFYMLCQLKGFEMFESDISQRNVDAWKAWIASEDLFERPMPGAAARLSEWHRLLLVKVLRLDKLIFCISRLVIGQPWRGLHAQPGVQP